MALFALFAFAFTAQSAQAAVVNNPGSFTAAISGGYINIGDPNDGGLGIPLDGMEVPPTVTGTVNGSGAISIPAANVNFPPVIYELGTDAINVAIRSNNQNWSGTINPSTGALSLNAYLQVQLTGTASGVSLGSSCFIGANGTNANQIINPNPTTTGTLPANPPAPSVTGVGYSQNGKSATVVNNTARIPGASNASGSTTLTGCGPLGLANGPVNDALGLPSASGKNVMNLELTFNTSFTGDVVPKFTVDPAAGQIPFEVDFDASSSESLAAPIALCDDVEVDEDCGYRWDFDGNGTVDEVTNTPETTHEYTQVAVYQPKLTICDENGLCSTDSTATVTSNSMELAFTSQPPAVSNQTSATFEFNSNVPEATFECSLDNGAWAECESPAIFSDLSDGEHQLRIRGVLDEEPSLPISSNAFVVETAHPVVTFGGGSPSNTNSATSGTVSWTATDANPPVTFECSYDGAEFAPCESGVEVSWPAELGQHTFAVRATDSLGNVGTTTHEWGFDNRPIEVVWTSSPVNPYINASGAVFTWEANREGVTSQCRKNGNAFANCASGTLGSGSFTNNANNTFEARAIDSYGNISNVVSQSFYYDTSAPGASTFSSPANNATVNTNTPTIVFSTPTGGSPIIQECSIDGGAYSPCSPPWTTPVLPSKGSAYVFRVRNRDAAGNVQTATIPTRNVTVNAPPLMEITGGPEEGSTVESNSAEFTFTADRVSGSSFSCKIDDGEYEPCSSPVTYNGLANGEHTFSVRGTRDVGTGAPATRSWTSDYTVPFDVAFDHGLVTFGLFSNINAVPEGEEITLSGEYTDDVGNFEVPVSGADFPTVSFDEGIISGTVQFAPTGKITGKYTASTGRLAISSKLRATVNLDGGLTCYLTRSMSFSTSAAGNGWQGVPFTDGLDGDGAVLAYWADVPPVNGGEGCSDLDPFVQGPGGLWLSHGIDSPPGEPINISAPVLTGTGFAGGQLKCAPGEWAGASSIANQWTRNGDVFTNVNENGKTRTTYNTTTADIGDAIACQQVATNAAGSVTQASNSLTIAAKPGGPVNIAPPTLTGTGFAGGQLKCAAGTWQSGTYSNVQLQWTRNGEVFTHVGTDGKTKTTYNTKVDDIGDEIACQQVATKSGFDPVTAASTPITIAARP